MSGTNVVLKFPMRFVDFPLFQSAALNSMLEHWSTSGRDFRKEVYLYNSKSNPIYIGQRMMRAVIDLCFSSNSTIHRVDLDDQEFKPMATVRSRRKRCSVCTGPVEKRGESICVECASLPKASRIIVKEANPTLIITVDTRWRWVTGSIQLDMNK